MLLKRFHHYLLAGLIVCGSPVFGQIVKFKTLGRDEGLPHSIITTMVQDDLGYMWFGTHDGLTRYDGYQFETYRPNAQDSFAIHDSWVIDLFADHQGRIWSRFNSGGISIYDPKKERFYTLLHDSTDPNSVSSDMPPNNEVVGSKHSVVQTNDGFLWIATQNGLNRVDPKTFKADRFYEGLEIESGLTSSRITTLYPDPTHDLLWVGTDKGLVQLNTRTLATRHYTMEDVLSDNFIRYIIKQKDVLWLGGRRSGVMRCMLNESQNIIKVDEILNQPHLDYSAKNRNVYQLFIASNEEVWAGTENGLYRISKDGKTAYNIVPGNSDYVILSITEDECGNIWAGGVSTEHGLFRFDPTRETLAEFNQNGYGNHGFSSNIINHLYVDGSGVLWAGTGKGGLIRSTIFNKQFETYTESAFKAKSPEEDEVYAIYIDENEQPLVGSKTALIQFDEQMNIQRKFYNGTRPGQLNWEVPGAFARIPGTDEAWVGYFEGKLSKYNLKTGRFKHYLTHDPKQKTAFAGWSLRDIIVSSDHTTYFATMSGGVIYQKKGEQIFHNLDDQLSGLKLRDTPILALYEDTKQRIWIGTNNRGVIIYHPKNQTVESIKHIPSDRKSLSHNEIRAFHQSKDGTMWIGTRYGLNALDLKTGDIQKFYETDGLPSNIIHALEEDEHTNLWLSTNMGISKFNVDDSTFVNFLKEDGLQGNEFNEGAHAKAADGTIYFGGANGITRFHPDSIKIDPQEPSVFFTSLSVNQQTVNAGTVIKSSQILDQAIHFTDKIELPYQLNNFTITFSTLNHRIPAKNRYRYRLAGLDEHWNYCMPGEHAATYAWLPTGEYLFEVQASNLDGVWSNQIKVLSVHVLPPWWKTLWFKIVATSLLVIGIGLIFSLNIRRLTLQRKILAQTVENRTEELLIVNNQLEEQRQQVLRQNRELQKNQYELEQQQRNLRLLSEMGQKITASVEIRDVFVQIFRIISELMNINELMVGKINNDTNTLEIWGVQSASENFTHDTISMDAVDRLSVYVAKNGKPVVSNKLPQIARDLLTQPSDKYFQQDAPQSGIYLPLKGARGKLKGLMVALTYSADAYHPKDETILQNLASYVSIAMDNASAYERIKMQSEQLVQVDKIKTDFYTNISHEFRTPLSLIQGPIQELVKDGKQSPEDLKLINIINRNAKLMLNLVEQIMELSKIDGGAVKLNLKPNCLSHQLQNISESFRHLAIQKSIHLVVDMPGQTVHGIYDQDILNKISYNLLNNAIKYTQNEGKVKFEVVYSNDGVHITVADNGRGIPEEDLKHIFDRFYRGSLPVEHQESGAGIGLALVHQLTTLVGGKINAKSTYEKDYSTSSGTTFSFYMPIKDLNIQPEVPEANPFVKTGDSLVETTNLEQVARVEKAESMLKTKVLVVEDNEDLREFMKDKLIEAYHVLTASNGKEALEVAKKEQPHLVISDIMMPEMNGIDLCQALKSDSLTSHIPVILITAKDALSDQKKGLEAGAIDYIVKPFDLDRLLLRVQNILSARLKLIDQYRENVWTGIQETNEDINPQDQKFLSSVKRIIEEQMENPDLDIDFFCTELGVSRTWLYTKMKGLLDISMNDFIRTCRLKHGAKLLVTERLSISQTAYAVGFNDPKYFAKCFKNEYGMGPKAYVKEFTNKVSVAE